MAPKATLIRLLLGSAAVSGVSALHVSPRLLRPALAARQEQQQEQQLQQNQPAVQIKIAADTGPSADDPSKGPDGWPGRLASLVWENPGIDGVSVSSNQDGSFLMKVSAG
jgi:hypothetical protein